MKPLSYGILFFVSILLAAITMISPWAEAVFHVGTYVSPWFDQVEETDETLTLPIHLWDESLRVDGCPRGPVGDLDERLDAWIWVGRAMFICQVVLWLLFLIGVTSRKGLKMVALWAAILIVLFFLFSLSLNPIVECVYTQFPAPLIFTGQWHINAIGIILCILNLSCGAWMNISMHKLPIKLKVG